MPPQCPSMQDPGAPTAMPSSCSVTSDLCWSIHSMVHCLSSRSLLVASCAPRAPCQARCQHHTTVGTYIRTLPPPVCRSPCCRPHPRPRPLHAKGPVRTACRARQPNSSLGSRPESGAPARSSLAVSHAQVPGSLTGGNGSGAPFHGDALCIGPLQLIVQCGAS